MSLVMFSPETPGKIKRVIRFFSLKQNKKKTFIELSTNVESYEIPHTFLYLNFIYLEILF